MSLQLERMDSMKELLKLQDVRYEIKDMLLFEHVTGTVKRRSHRHYREEWCWEIDIITIDSRYIITNYGSNSGSTGFKNYIC